MFRSATFRLTIWYLVIIMAISLLFSFVIYNASDRELQNGYRRQVQIYRLLPSVQYPDNILSPEEQLQAAEQRLRFNLGILNLAILGATGAAGYLLAKRTLRPIEEALDVQSRFTADASHELRTPLTAMKTEIEVAMRDAKLSAAEARELLKSNLEEISKLEALSNGLLKLAQHDNGGINKEPVSLSKIAGEAIQRLDKQAKQRSVTFKNAINNDTVVLGDHQSLTELIYVLLDNAIKYSPADSTVELGSSVSGHYAYLNVRDHGQGIKASDIPHIFERFFRSDTSRSKNKVDGYGLGLSIAQKIAEMHQGMISVKSSPGEGSTFTIKLPLT